MPDNTMHPDLDNPAHPIPVKPTLKVTKIALREIQPPLSLPAISESKHPLTLPWDSGELSFQKVTQCMLAALLPEL